MLLFKYLVLGIIQGITEVLPISSSGHLKIIRTLFNDNAVNDMNFEIIVNFGSFIAILIFYRKEILNIITDFILYIKTKKNKYKINFKYSILIIIGTIPAAIFGIFLKSFVEEYFNIKLVGLMLIITSLLLYMIKDIKGKKEKEDISYIDAIKIGLFQVIALLPGISRSGSTIVGGIKSGLSRKAAFDFSFMLYIPISVASMILGINDLINSNNLSNLIIPYFISMIFAGLFTYISLKTLKKLINKGKLVYFSIYCFIIGLLIFITF